MPEPFIDTDVIVRLLSGDDPAKQAAAAALFDEVATGRLAVAAPDTVIADAVFVLSSPRLYHLPRAQVSGLLTTLVRLPGFRVANWRAVLRALDLFGTSNLGFGDAMIVASMEQAGATTVYSFDRHFDAVQGIVRQEPADTAGGDGGSGS